jgi:hypothetical protein
MKKFHWGHAILVFFIIYVLTLIFVLYKSTTVDHSLVVQDYYNQDIHYQEKYDKVKNVATYSKSIKVDWSAGEKKLSVIFQNDNGRKGVVKLYNPADTQKDISFDLKKESLASYEYAGINLSAGRWKVQVDWEEDGVPFFIEKEIYIAQP